MQCNATSKICMSVTNLGLLEDYPANCLILKCLIPIFRNMYNCKLSNNKECLKQKNTEWFCKT